MKDMKWENDGELARSVGRRNEENLYAKMIEIEGRV